MNLKIKYRESFRPFAPSVLAERVSDYFDLDRPSPYMLLVAPIKENLHIPMTQEQQQLFGIDEAERSSFRNSVRSLMSITRLVFRQFTRKLILVTMS